MEYDEVGDTGVVEKVMCIPKGEHPCAIVYRRDTPSGAESRVHIVLQTPHGHDHDVLAPGKIVHTFLGIHGEVRGCIVDGRVLWMRSERESSERLLAELREAREQRNAQETARHGPLEARYASLPQAFRERIGQCDQSPEFHRKLFLAEEAAKILEVCHTREEIEHFSSLRPAEQYQLIPSLSHEHSGATFAGAIALAFHMASHGAPRRSLE